jgi:hypothetical protein
MGFISTMMRLTNMTDSSTRVVSLWARYFVP